MSAKFPSGWFDDDTDFERRRRRRSPSVVSAKFRSNWPDSGEHHTRDHYHRSHHHRPAGRENYNFRRDERALTGSPRPVVTNSLRINGKGEPQGEGETVFSRQLAVVVRKHVPVESMWSSVRDETKYKICQEAQAAFKDGAKIDSS